MCLFTQPKSSLGKLIPITFESTGFPLIDTAEKPVYPELKWYKVET